MTSKANGSLNGAQSSRLTQRSTVFQDPTVERVESVSEHISFVLKMSKYVTHIKRLKEPEEGVARFLKLRTTEPSD